MKLNPSNINKIIREDLTDPEKLADLYCQAVKRKYWPNSDRDLLEFFALAEKALADDKMGFARKTVRLAIEEPTYQAYH